MIESAGVGQRYRRPRPVGGAGLVAPPAQSQYRSVSPVGANNPRVTDQAPGVGPGLGPQPYQPNGPAAAQTLPALTNPGIAPNVTQAREAGSGPATPATIPAESGGLRGETYLPGNDPRLAGAQGATDAAAAGVAGAPSISDETQSLYGRYRSLLSGGQTRFDAAKGVLQNLDENQGLARTQGIRKIGQSAAALGRTGAGMTTNDLTGLEASLDRNREQSLRQLSADTTEGDINDRFRTLDYGVSGATANNADRYRRLDAARGVEGQVFGEGQSNRDEYRTERGRQDALGQQTLENQIRQRELGNTEMNDRWRRAMGLANAGNTGAPSLDDILRMSR